jgi:hypothetical protein
VENNVLKKVVVKISGGIGNQLFQLAAALAISRKFGAQLEIDETSFNGYTYHHEPEIEKLGLEFKKHVYNENEFQYTYVLTDKLITHLEQLQQLPERCEILVLEGYWQSEGFVPNDIIDLIEKTLDKKYALNANKQIQLSSISAKDIAIHIRRRDYTHMGVACEEYYIASLWFLKEANSNAKVAIFSDEPNYSLNFLTKAGITGCYGINTSDDWLDLYIMSHFKQIIIANSTFSWWGARLFEKKFDKNIFHPSPWVTVDPTLQPCPPRWRSVANSTIVRGIDETKVREFLCQITQENNNKHGTL